LTDGVESETRSTLEAVAAVLTEARAPAGAIERVRALADQVGRPCVVAVVGHVNAGKSTFINALLGDDKAIVGRTETTATINAFVHGPADADAGVRCYWRAGHVTQETPEFLASLQGFDDEALERSSAIARLEFALPSTMLRAITLVDTPGTGAVVAEHEQRTAAFLALAGELRRRHHEETVALHEQADAVIYLVDAVAQASEQQMLERFTARDGVRARAMNTLGVLAKVDRSPDLVARRHDLARRIASQLEDELNTVVPVSAALARTLDRLDEDRLTTLLEVARVLSDAHVALLLKDERLFTGYDPEGCAVPSVERRDLYEAAACEWRVFATMFESAREAATVTALRADLEDVAGFDLLRRTLEEQFLTRAQMLRCFRLAASARELLRELWFGQVSERKRRLGEDLQRSDRFLAFVRDAPGDHATATELLDHLTAERRRLLEVPQLESAFKRADSRLGELLDLLGEFSADFAALQELEAAPPSTFSDDEDDELRALLGLYGADPQRRLRGEVRMEHCLQQQVRWRLSRDGARRGSVRWRVADRAHTRLGLIITSLSG
jgi:ribosome biogenesis GTPase A